MTVIARTLVDGSSQGLLAHVNPSAGAFASPADGFEIYQRGVSARIPFALLDDTLSIFPADTLGIIGEAETSPFFGVADTENADNAGPVLASWTFDIAGASDLVLSIDMGAMGNFENDDSFTWSYAIDGGTELNAFTSTVDEAASQTYTLDSGTAITLDDPMLVDGTLLTDDPATFTTALAGSGAELVLTLTALTNGDGEAIAFRNIVVEDDGVTEPPPPPPEFVLISAVQGDGAATPILDQVVTVEAVVTADFQAEGLNGFFLQEETADEDGDAATSEGLFVFEGGNAIDVGVGDTVRVTGRMTEFFGKTELTDVTAVEVVTDRAPGVDLATLVTPVDLALPLSAPAAQATANPLEAFEGMHLAISTELFVTQLFELERYGTLHLAADDRLVIPTQVAAPGADANAVALANALNRIILDDATNVQNLDGLPAYLPDGDIRGGDSVTGLTGVLDWDFSGQAGTNAYRIRTNEPVEFARNQPRDDAPDTVGSEFTVASFNVLNYFTTLGERGADSEAELAIQTAKIVAALDALDADIIGLIEIENDGGASAEALVGALNGATGKAYAVVETGGPVGTDAITTALVYDTATTGFDPTNVAILDDPAFTDPLDTGTQLNRPAVAATFEDRATGGAVTVAVNHLKSKGSGSGDPRDDDQGDGQGASNATRTAAAEVLADWLANDPTGAGEADSLIIGDLNAYLMEGPIRALLAAGYSDLALQFAATGSLEPYSFRFSGEWGTLDYALADADLLGQVTGATIWHINADEPEFLDYDDNVRDPGEATFEVKPDAQFALVDPDSPFRASDHDPVLVGLRLSPTGEPVAIAPAAGNAPAVTIVRDDGAATIALSQNRPSVVLDDLVEITALAGGGRARLWIQDGAIGVNEPGIDKGALREVLDAGESLALDFAEVLDVYRAEITLDLGDAAIGDLAISAQALNAVTVQTDPGGLVVVDGLGNGTIDSIELGLTAGAGVTVSGIRLFVDDAAVT